MKNIAVIPARGGSTRLKDKNIHPLGGKPLIRWITETVLNSGVFDEVVVSTDSDGIFDVVSNLGVLGICAHKCATTLCGVPRPTMDVQTCCIQLATVGAATNAPLTPQGWACRASDEQMFIVVPSFQVRQQRCG